MRERNLDFSILQQESVIKEIISLEKKLTKKQLKNAKKQAEQILTRPLLNFTKLHSLL